MSRRSLVLAGVALTPLLLLALAVGAARLSHRPVEVGLVDGRLRPCPPSPNCICSEEGGSESSISPLGFGCAPKAAFLSLVEFLEAEPNATIIDVRDGYVHAVYRTRFLGFADDVEFRLDAEARAVHVRSASRIGYSDLGANRARIDDLRRRWKPPAEGREEGAG